MSTHLAAVSCVWRRRRWRLPTSTASPRRGSADHRHRAACAVLIRVRDRSAPRSPSARHAIDGFASKKSSTFSRSREIRVRSRWPPVQPHRQAVSSFYGEHSWLVWAPGVRILGRPPHSRDRALTALGPVGCPNREKTIAPRSPGLRGVARRHRWDHVSNRSRASPLRTTPWPPPGRCPAVSGTRRGAGGGRRRQRWWVAASRCFSYARCMSATPATSWPGPVDEHIAPRLATSALLIIDTQVDFVDGGRSPLQGRRRLYRSWSSFAQHFSTPVARLFTSSGFTRATTSTVSGAPPWRPARILSLPAQQERRLCRSYASPVSERRITSGF